ncbi:MAG: hypothetical protein FJ125_04530, partial [Deltaproteobacteria bacterium]|nr:hypothetical protein [Deltaproteobacteria bacterium]
MEIAFVPPLTLLRSASWEALELDEPEPERIDELLLETTWVSGEERLRWRTTGWLAAPCCCWEPEAALRLCEIAGRSPLLARIGWSVEGARCGELLLGRLRLAGWPREMAAHLTLLGAGADGRACSLETVWLPALLAEDLEALAHGTSFELLCRRDPLGALRVRISLTVLAAGTRSSSATLPARSGELAERLQHQPLEWDEEESQTPLRRPT